MTTTCKTFLESVSHLCNNKFLKSGAKKKYLFRKMCELFLVKQDKHGTFSFFASLVRMASIMACVCTPHPKPRNIGAGFLEVPEPRVCDWFTV